MRAAEFHHVAVNFGLVPYEIQRAKEAQKLPRKKHVAPAALVRSRRQSGRSPRVSAASVRREEVSAAAKKRDAAEWDTLFGVASTPPFALAAFNLQIPGAVKRGKQERGSDSDAMEADADGDGDGDDGSDGSDAESKHADPQEGDESGSDANDDEEEEQEEATPPRKRRKLRRAAVRSPPPRAFCLEAPRKHVFLRAVSARARRRRPDADPQARPPADGAGRRAAALERRARPRHGRSRQEEAPPRRASLRPRFPGDFGQEARARACCEKGKGR